MKAIVHVYVQSTSSFGFGLVWQSHNRISFFPLSSDPETNPFHTPFGNGRRDWKQVSPEEDVPPLLTTFTTVYRL